MSQAVDTRQAGLLKAKESLMGTIKYINRTKPQDELPAYRGKEIDETTLEAHADTIFSQAENRLHAQKAIINWLVG